MSVPSVPRRSALPQSPPLRTHYVVGALAVVVLAALVGWGLRTISATEVPAPEPPRAIVAGPVGLSVPGAWTPERVALAEVPGLPAHAAVFAPTGGLRAHALVMLSAIDHPSLVAAPLRALAAEPLGTPRKTTLAGLQAWTYRDVPVAGDRLLQITVAPTTGGVLTVACLARSLSWLAAAGCASDARDATLTGATALRPQPALAYRTKLPGAIEHLGDRRALLRSKLRRASSRRGQARFAARLGRANARTAARLAPWAPAKGAPRAVDRALRATARAYGQLSAAARHGWPRRYRFARRAVRRGDAALSRALARVG